MSAAVLTAKELIARASLRTAPVEIEGGGRVFVRELSVDNRAKFLERHRADPLSVAAWLFVQSVVDESGARIFTDTDEESIRDLSPRVIDAVGKATLDLSGVENKAGDDEGEA